MGGKSKAGELREVVLIQRKSMAAASEDDFGQPVDTYVNLATRPRESASIIPVSGSEIEQAAQLVGIALYQVEMRYRTDLTADCRLKWLTTGNGTEPFLYVKSLPADPTGRKERIQFLAVQSDVPVEP